LPPPDADFELNGRPVEERSRKKRDCWKRRKQGGMPAELLWRLMELLRCPVIELLWR